MDEDQRQAELEEWNNAFAVGVNIASFIQDILEMKCREVGDSEIAISAFWSGAIDNIFQP